MLKLNILLLGSMPSLYKVRSPVYYISDDLRLTLLQPSIYFGLRLKQMCVLEEHLLGVVTQTASFSRSHCPQQSGEIQATWCGRTRSMLGRYRKERWKTHPIYFQITPWTILGTGCYQTQLLRILFKASIGIHSTIKDDSDGNFTLHYTACLQNSWDLNAFSTFIYTLT